MSNTDETVERNKKVIDELVVRYNKRDAAGFAALFTEEGVHGTLHAETQQRGREQIVARYNEVFALHPENKTTVVHRIAFGAFVIDHEKVQRGASSEAFDVVAMYTLRDGFIARCEFVRAQ
jgi:uncharacterized protein (TIGR02246 family)